VTKSCFNNRENGGRGPKKGVRKNRLHGKIAFKIREVDNWERNRLEDWRLPCGACLKKRGSAGRVAQIRQLVDAKNERIVKVHVAGREPKRKETQSMNHRWNRDGGGGRELSSSKKLKRISPVPREHKIISTGSEQERWRPNTVTEISVGAGGIVSTQTGWPSLRGHGVTAKSGSTPSSARGQAGVDREPSWVRLRPT